MELIGKITDKLLSIWLFFLQRKKKRAGDAFVDFAEINAIIKNWVHFQRDLNIETALILKAHNGNPNKKLMPVGYKYSSVLANDYRTPFKDIRIPYQNLAQDNDYVARVANVYVRKEIEIEVAKMENGVLKTLYTNEGIAYAKWFFLAHNEEELWLLSIGTSNRNEYFLSERHKASIYLGVNRIRQIVKPYFK